MNKVLAILAIVMLGGCTTAAGFNEAAKTTIKQGADIEATAALDILCATTYGAFTRQPLEKQLAIELACGGDWLTTLRNIGVINDTKVPVPAPE